MSRAATPRVSVLTPFHNTAEYLAECIESVLGQTCADFEYVLLDNQSTDGSGDIAAAYAARDPRIRLMKTDRLLGQVANYNHALRLVSPEARQVKIVQADDWIFPRCLEEMAGLMDEHPGVVVVSSYVHKETAIHGVGLCPSRRVISGREACRLHLLQGIYMFGSPTSVMFRADVVRARDPFYAEGRLHEDTEVIHELLRDGDFGFIHQVLSFSRQQASSIMGRARGFDALPLDRLILLKAHGRACLTEAEHAACLKEAEDRYYRHLARAWLLGREEAYWSYHQKGLATIGETIDRAALRRHIVLAGLEYIIAPPAKELGRRLAQRVAGVVR